MLAVQYAIKLIKASNRISVAILALVTVASFIPLLMPFGMSILELERNLMKNGEAMLVSGIYAGLGMSSREK